MNWYSNDFPITRETETKKCPESWGSGVVGPQLKEVKNKKQFKERNLGYLSQHEWHGHSNPEKHPEERL